MAVNWLRKAVNIVWYEGLTGQYEPELHIIKDIARMNEPLIPKMDAGQNTKQKKAEKFVPTVDQVYHYFFKSGLEEPGSCNVFMSQKGFTGDLNLHFDSTAITNPQFLRKGNTAGGGELFNSTKGEGTVNSKGSYEYNASYELGPKLEANLGLGYSKLGGSLVLTLKLPATDEYLLALDILGNHFFKGNAGTFMQKKRKIFPIAYYEMKGLSTQKKISGSLCLSVSAKVEAAASVNIEADISKQLGPVNSNKLMNGGASAEVNGAAGVTMEFMNFSGALASDYAFFTCPATLFFEKECDLITNIMDRIYNKIITYNKDLHLKVERLPPLNLENTQAYFMTKDGGTYATIEMFTTAKAKSMEAVKATAVISAGGSANISGGGPVGMECGTEFTLIDTQLSVHAVEDKSSSKTRKYRINLPIPSYMKGSAAVADNPFAMYTQDTEVIYCSERSYSKFGYDFKMNKLLGVSFHAMGSSKEFNCLADYEKSSARNVTGSNTLMYSSINNVWKPRNAEADTLLGSCYVIGKSIDLRDLYALYRKCEDINKLMKNEFGESDFDIRRILQKLEDNSFNLEAFVKKSSLAGIKSVLDNVLKPSNDFISVNWSLNRFKRSTYMSMAQRKTIKKVDNALKLYLDSNQKFNLVKNGLAIDMLLQEVNKRTVLLENIVVECDNWIAGKQKDGDVNKNARTGGVRELKAAAEKAKRVMRSCVQGNDPGRNDNSGCYRTFVYALEVVKLLETISTVYSAFRDLKLSPSLVMNYLFMDSEAIYDCVCDLISINIQAVIFEAVFDTEKQLEKKKYCNGYKLYYYPGDQDKKVSEIKFDHDFSSGIPGVGEFLDSFNKGIRMYYRMEDKFENMKQIFQLGTRSLGIEGKTGLDINCSLSYKNQIGSFAAITLFKAQKKGVNDNDFDRYMKTVLLT